MCFLILNKGWILRIPLGKRNVFSELIVPSKQNSVSVVIIVFNYPWQTTKGKFGLEQEMGVICNL